MLEHPAHLTESNDDFFRTLLRYIYDTLEKNTLDLCIVFLSQFLQRGEKKTAFTLNGGLLNTLLVHEIPRYC